MNEDQIEKALRNAPQPAPPPGLRERLEQQIQVSAGKANGGTRLPWFIDWRRPLLGWAALLIAVMVIGVQSHQVGQLRRDNERLIETVAAVEELHAAALLDDRNPQFQNEIERLRRENVELHRLRAEVARLRGEVRQLDPLRAEIVDLQARLAAADAVPPTVIRDVIDPEETNEMNCVNHLKQIALAALVYEQSTGDGFPSDYLAMSDELVTPRLLRCPSDTGRIAAESWSQFMPSVHSTYEWLNPGGSSDQPPVVFARCPIHGFVAMSDGRVARTESGAPIGSPQSGDFEGTHDTNFPGQRPIYGIEPSADNPPPEYYDQLMLERYGIVPSRPATPTTDSP